MAGGGADLLRRWLPPLDGVWVVVLAVGLGVGGPLWAVWSKSRAAGRTREVVAGRIAGGGEEGGAAGSGLDLQNAMQEAASRRIQLTVALAQAGSLRLARERSEGRIPADAVSVAAGLVRDGILPPSLAGPGKGSGGGLALFSSKEAWYVLRYTPDRFVVEVVSVPRMAAGAGPPMLARIPDDQDLFGDAPGFYVRAERPGARSADLPLEDQMPPAFVDAVTLVGAGWKINRLPQAQAAAGSGVGR